MLRGTPGGTTRGSSVSHSSHQSCDVYDKPTLVENLFSSCVHLKSTSCSASSSSIAASPSSYVSAVSCNSRDPHRLWLSQMVDFDGPPNVAVKRVRNCC